MKPVAAVKMQMWWSRTCQDLKSKCYSVRMVLSNNTLPTHPETFDIHHTFGLIQLTVSPLFNNTFIKIITEMV
jgi:hypothetical protein